VRRRLFWAALVLALLLLAAGGLLVRLARGAPAHATA
jgi:hypothetical protein